MTLGLLPSTSHHLHGCCCLVAQSCLTLGDPVDCSLPGSPVHGIFQARILEWVAISFSRGSSPPKDRTLISCLVGGFFTIEPPLQPPQMFPMTGQGLQLPDSRILPQSELAPATLLWFSCSLPVSPPHPSSSPAGDAGTPFPGPSSILPPHQLSLTSLPSPHQLSWWFTSNLEKNHLCAKGSEIATFTHVSALLKVVPGHPTYRTNSLPAWFYSTALSTFEHTQECPSLRHCITVCLC